MNVLSGKNNSLIFSILLLTIFIIASNDVSAATSPSLGAASSFAVLGAQAVTNVPTSAITGDVGLSPAAGSNYAGLTVAQVTGTIYAVDATGPAGSVPNPVLLTSAQAANTAAFLALSAPPNVACDVDYGAVTKDLVGLSLVPGVYCANVFQLTTGVPLTLNAAGDPNAVWIFRTTAADAALTTTPGVGANVQFLNGIGSSCNVWWKVASSATIGSGTTFIGNILALTSISMGTGANLNGKVLAQTGAVTLDANTINTVICQPTTNTTTTTTTSSTTTSTIPGKPKPVPSLSPIFMSLLLASMMAVGIIKLKSN